MTALQDNTAFTGAAAVGAGPTPERLGRLLIFIVAYNAERTIEDVLRRIPTDLAARYEVEVLIIDDDSSGTTPSCAANWPTAGVDALQADRAVQPGQPGLRRQPEDGFHYAIENGFDMGGAGARRQPVRARVSARAGRGLAGGEAEAVFGSRMLDRGGALRGGMPLYKFVGNKILTRFQNLLLGTRLSEFHKRLPAVQHPGPGSRAL